MSLGTILLHMSIGLLIILVLIMKVKLNAVASLFIGSLYVGIACKLGLTGTVSAFASGFGGTMASLGMSIAFGVIMGQLLADSGAAYVIAHTMVSAFPKEKALYALSFTALFISMPVFFDVVLVIMIPIAFAIAKEIKAPRAMIAVALTCGPGCGHSYVPPTPAPLQATEAFGFSIGSMMGFGLIISAIAIFATIPIMKAFLWPKSDKMKWYWNEEVDTDPMFEPIKMKDYSGVKLPSFGVAVLPVLVPIILILITSVWDAVGETPEIISFLGNKNIAMLIAALTAQVIGLRYNMNQNDIKKSINTALASCGMVLLITGAGSAFGAVIRKTGITDILTEMLTASQAPVVVVLLISFFVGTVLRACMGSASSAGVSALAIMAPIVAAMPQVHPAWFAMAVLSGCNCIGLPNDSGFWMSTNLNGLTITGGLKTYTVFGAIRAVLILCIVLIGAVILPLGV